MLTRAYDTIVAAQTAFIVNGTSFNTSDLHEDVLSCKDCAGNIRNLYYRVIKSDGSSYSAANVIIPFNAWTSSSSTNDADCCRLIPDEDASEPSYEDYQIESTTPTGWYDYNNIKYAGSWDTETKSWISSVTMLYQNNSGSNKTVYGVKIGGNAYYRYSATDTSGYVAPLLVAREHFSEPVIVGDQEMLFLTFSWRTTRTGLLVQASGATEEES